MYVNSVINTFATPARELDYTLPADRASAGRLSRRKVSTTRSPMKVASIHGLALTLRRMQGFSHNTLPTDRVASTLRSVASRTATLHPHAYIRARSRARRIINHHLATCDVTSATLTVLICILRGMAQHLQSTLVQDTHALNLESSTC